MPLTEGVRTASGLASLLAPHPTARRQANGATPLPAGVMRVLGARQIAQAAVLLTADPPAHRVGALVDGLHAASMVLLAVVSPRLRRAAITQSVLASGFAASELAAARRAG